MSKEESATSASMTDRERDRRVAERVMGWKRAEDNDPKRRMLTGEVWFTSENCLEDLPYFNTDISAAFRVVKRIRERGWAIDIGILSNKASVWRCSLANFTTEHAVTDEKLCRAVCEAALKAVEGHDADDPPVGQDGTR